jgi:hypothetical protein
MDKNTRHNEELRRFRAEAAALLGIEATPAEQEKKTPPADDGKEQSPTRHHEAADAPKKPTDPQVQQLIAQLGSDSFAEREAASKRLEAIGEPAWNAARKAAAGSPDPEIRHRAGRVAEAIGRRCFGEIRRFVGHKGPVLRFAFSADGRRAVSGGDNATAILWDVASGREIRRSKGHTGTIQDVAFSPDGRHVLTGSEDTTARFLCPTDPLARPPGCRTIAHGDLAMAQPTDRRMPDGPRAELLLFRPRRDAAAVATSARAETPPRL